MRRTVVIVNVIIASLLLGCTRSQATVKYRTSDKNVSAGQTLLWSFDRDRAGSVPARTQVFGGTWEVRKDADAPCPPNAVCQTGTAQYPALSLGDKIFGDVVISTRFKPVSGNSDRAAGIAFRIQDKDNYYILRANALEDNVNFYRYTGGRRSLIREGTATVPTGKWQELRVEVKGNTMRGYLGGKLVVEATDDAFKAGQVGLWTKADSVACFDDVKAVPQ